MLGLKTPRIVDYAIVLGATVVAGWAVWQFLAAPSRRPTSRTTATASYVGASVCAGCHTTEHELWSGSHHDLAMQVASDETVLGDFKNASFT